MRTLATASIIALGALVLGRAPAVRAEPSLDQAFAIDTEGQGSAPSLLTAHAPANQRAQMTRTFETLLAGYRNLARKAGIPANDPDGAVAMFIAGNLCALRKIDVSDRAFAALRAQLRAHPEIARGLKADRPAVADQLAIVGMFMLLTQRSTLDDAGARAVNAAAHNYVTTYLGTDIEPLEITDAGLTWSRPPAGLLAGLASGNAAPRKHDDAIAGKVETIAFHQTFHLGFNNMVVFDWDPVVLFKGGEGSLSLAALEDPAADKQRNPNKWITWRKAGGKYQIQIKGAWKDSKFEDGPMPALDGGGGGFSEHVAVNSERATQVGTYDLSGYRLTLKYDSGEAQVRTLFMNRNDRKMIYLDGVAYLQKD